MLTRLKTKLVGVGAAAVVVAGLAAPIYALSNNPAGTGQAEPANQPAPTSQATGSDQKEGQEGKLNDARKKVCQARQSAINKIMQDAAAAGQRHLNLFNGAATRIEQFYTNKKLTVANYSQLVADVNSKKAAATSAVDAVKSGSTLDCNGNNPVGGVSGFRTKVVAMHQALQDYRTSIVSLLTAVKTAAETSNAGGNQ